MRLTAIAVIFAMGCTVPQAYRTRHVSEIVAGTALSVMIAAAIVQATVPDVKDEAKTVAIATIPVTLFSIGTYIAADQRIPDVDTAPVVVEQRSEANNRAARKLAHEAAVAARAHDCDQVRALELQIKDLDFNVHLAILRNRRIVACLRDDGGL